MESFWPAFKSIQLSSALVTKMNSKDACNMDMIVLTNDLNPQTGQPN